MIYAIMLLMIDRLSFSEWLQNELDKREWKQADLVHASQLSRSIISKILLGESQPQPETLQSIARGLRLPADLVFRKAGLLPPAVDVDEVAEAIAHKIMLLPPEERQEILDILQVKLDRQDKKKITTSRGKSRLELIKDK